MVVSVSTTAREYFSIAAGVDISVDIPVFAADEVVVYYGIDALVATQGVHYVLQIAQDFNTFIITPQQSLVDAIAALIALNPDEQDRIVARRQMNYLTSSTPDLTRYTPYTSREHDRLAMRDLQLAEEVNRSVKFAPTFIGETPLLQLNEAAPNRALILNADGTAVVAGPTASEIAGAQAASEIAAAAATLHRLSRTTADAQALIAGLDDGERGMMQGLLYEKDSTATGSDSCTDDLGVDGLVPAFGRGTPAHFGASGLVGTDAVAAVNRAHAWLANGYDNTDLNTFKRFVDYNVMYTVSGPVNWTNVRQPGSTANFGPLGGLYSTATGGIVLDMSGTNTPEVTGILRIETPLDGSSAPDIGLLRSRALFGGDPEPIAPNHQLNVQIEGVYNKAGMVNLGSEVSEVRGQIVNKINPKDTAHGNPRGYVGTGHHQTLVDLWGAEITSSFVTIPTVADGAMSNILHNLEGLHVKMSSAYNLTVTAISKGATTSVTVDDIKTAANGDVIMIDTSDMVEIEYMALKIANLSGSTFDVTDLDGNAVDSTLFTSASNGTVWCATGAAVTIGSGRGFSMGPQAYILTTIEPSVEIDCRSANPGVIDLAFQQEKSPLSPVRIITASGGSVVKQLSLSVMSTSQQVPNAAIEVDMTSGGSLRIDDLRYRQPYLQGSFGVGFFNPVGGGALTDIAVRHGDVVVSTEEQAAQFVNQQLGSYLGRVRSVVPAWDYFFGTQDADEVFGVEDDTSGNTIQILKLANGYLRFSGVATATFSSSELLQVTVDWDDAHGVTFAGSLTDVKMGVSLEAAGASLTSTPTSETHVSSGAVAAGNGVLQVRNNATNFVSGDTINVAWDAEGRWK